MVITVSQPAAVIPNPLIGQLDMMEEKLERLIKRCASHASQAPAMPVAGAVRAEPVEVKAPPAAAKPKSFADMQIDLLMQGLPYEDEREEAVDSDYINAVLRDVGTLPSQLTYRTESILHQQNTDRWLAVRYLKVHLNQMRIFSGRFGIQRDSYLVIRYRGQETALEPVRLDLADHMHKQTKAHTPRTMAKQAKDSKVNMLAKYFVGDLLLPSTSVCFPIALDEAVVSDWVSGAHLSIELYSYMPNSTSKSKVDKDYKLYASASVQLKHLLYCNTSSGPRDSQLKDADEIIAGNIFAEQSAPSSKYVTFDCVTSAPLVMNEEVSRRLAYRQDLVNTKLLPAASRLAYSRATSPSECGLLAVRLQLLNPAGPIQQTNKTIIVHDTIVEPATVKEATYQLQARHVMPSISPAVQVAEQKEVVDKAQAALQFTPSAPDPTPVPKHGLLPAVRAPISVPVPPGRAFCGLIVHGVHDLLLPAGLLPSEQLVIRYKLSKTLADSMCVYLPHTAGDRTEVRVGQGKVYEAADCAQALGPARLPVIELWLQTPAFGTSEGVTRRLLGYTPPHLPGGADGLRHLLEVISVVPVAQGALVGRGGQVEMQGICGNSAQEVQQHVDRLLNRERKDADMQEEDGDALSIISMDSLVAHRSGQRDGISFTYIHTEITVEEDMDDEDEGDGVSVDSLDAGYAVTEEISTLPGDDRLDDVDDVEEEEAPMPSTSCPVPTPMSPVPYPYTPPRRSGVCDTHVLDFAMDAVCPTHFASMHMDRGVEGVFVCYSLTLPKECSDAAADEEEMSFKLYWDNELSVINTTQRHRFRAPEGVLSLQDLEHAMRCKEVHFAFRPSTPEGEVDMAARPLGSGQLSMRTLLGALEALRAGGRHAITVPLQCSGSCYEQEQGQHEVRIRISHRIEPAPFVLPSSIVDVPVPIPVPSSTSVPDDVWECMEEVKEEEEAHGHSHGPFVPIDQLLGQQQHVTVHVSEVRHLLLHPDHQAISSSSGRHQQHIFFTACLQHPHLPGGAGPVHCSLLLTPQEVLRWDERFSLALPQGCEAVDCALLLALYLRTSLFTTLHDADESRRCEGVRASDHLLGSVSQRVHRHLLSGGAYGGWHHVCMDALPVGQVLLDITTEEVQAPKEEVEEEVSMFETVPALPQECDYAALHRQLDALTAATAALLHPCSAPEGVQGVQEEDLLGLESFLLIPVPMPVPSSTPEEVEESYHALPDTTVHLLGSDSEEEEEEGYSSDFDSFSRTSTVSDIEHTEPEHAADASADDEIEAKEVEDEVPTAAPLEHVEEAVGEDSDEDEDEHPAVVAQAVDAHEDNEVDEEDGVPAGPAAGDETSSSSSDNEREGIVPAYVAEEEGDSLCYAISDDEQDDDAALQLAQERDSTFAIPLIAAAEDRGVQTEEYAEDVEVTVPPQLEDKEVDAEVPIATIATQTSPSSPSMASAVGMVMQPYSPPALSSSRHVPAEDGWQPIRIDVPKHVPLPHTPSAVPAPASTVNAKPNFLAITAEMTRRSLQMDPRAAVRELRARQATTRRTDAFLDRVRPIVHPELMR